MSEQTAIIIGAGPAGLTAAKELLRQGGVTPIVLEATEAIGGISRTVRHNGNRMDIGGHRFFSKSNRVMNWWREVMPLMGPPRLESPAYDARLLSAADPAGPDPDATDRVMLVRSRLSRIFFLRKFFDYPISLSPRTLMNMGLARTVRVGLGYLRARLRPIKPERSLEDFFINRFGRPLYGLFFKDYTEKVWGVPCDQIEPEWGAQRVKGLSVAEALRHAATSLLKRGQSGQGVDQKDTATSLIERFLYPKLGPGQLWETVAGQVRDMGGRVELGRRVTGLELDNGRVARVRAVDQATGEEAVYEADWVLSSMPVRDLLAVMDPPPPAEAAQVAAGLQYRDFITVGMLVDRLKIGGGMAPDNWIYIQERDVKLGRLQIFNNWSPYLVADPNKVWLGLEYFCDEGDELWTMADQAMIDFAAAELARIDIIADAGQVRDAVVVRVPKAYPAYFGAYTSFDQVRRFTDGIANLFLIGRNGMHRYNNQDHSMLTAMLAAEAIAAGSTDKSALWAVNIDDAYHEEGD